MKPLNDPTFLHKHKGVLYEKENLSKYYRSGKSLEELKYYWKENYYNKSLFCRLLCENRYNNSQCFNRRVNQAFLSVQYLYSGCMSVCSDGTSYIAEAHDICLFHPHKTHEFLVDSPEETHQVGIILEGPLLDTLLDALKLNRINTIYFPDAKRFKSYVDRLEVALRAETSSASHDVIAGICYELIQTLATAQEISETKIPHKIIEIKDYLKGHYATDLSMHELAKSHGMTLQTLNMKFKKYLSTTAYQYLIRQRMLNASRYLQEEALSIKEVATKVGFDNSLNFSTAFRKFYGISPRHYIRQNSS